MIDYEVLKKNIINKGYVFVIFIRKNEKIKCGG